MRRCRGYGGEEEAPLKKALFVRGESSARRHKAEARLNLTSSEWRAEVAGAMSGYAADTDAVTAMAEAGQDFPGASLKSLGLSRLDGFHRTISFGGVAKSAFRSENTSRNGRCRTRARATSS